MRVLFFIYIILWSGQLSAQGNKVFSIQGNFTDFSVDNLGFIYAVTSKDQQLKKYKPNGDSMSVFNELKRYGKLSAIDTRNPLRTVLFYRDFRTVVLLDRFLQPVNTIQLRKLNLFQTEKVAPSYDNHIWIFDLQENKLKKISESSKLLLETADLRLVLDVIPSPVDMIDQEGLVYIYDKQKGMFIFDYYGAFKGRLALIGWENVQVIDQTIMGTKEGKWLQYKTGSLQLKETNLPEFSRNAKKIQLTSSGIFILDETGIHKLTYIN